LHCGVSEVGLEVLENAAHGDKVAKAMKGSNGRRERGEKKLLKENESSHGAAVRAVQKAGNWATVENVAKLVETQDALLLRCKLNHGFACRDFESFNEIAANAVGDSPGGIVALVLECIAGVKLGFAVALREGAGESVKAETGGRETAINECDFVWTNGAREPGARLEELEELSCGVSRRRLSKLAMAHFAIQKWTHRDVCLPCRAQIEIFQILFCTILDWQWRCANVAF
jgi:hypothetical protein